MSPRKTNVDSSGIGGTMPKKDVSPPSSGRTLFASASAQKSSRSSFTFSGCSAATFFDCVKSSGR